MVRRPRVDDANRSRVPRSVRVLPRLTKPTATCAHRSQRGSFGLAAPPVSPKTLHTAVQGVCEQEGGFNKVGRVSESSRSCPGAKEDPNTASPSSS